MAFSKEAEALIILRKLLEEIEKSTTDYPTFIPNLIEVLGSERIKYSFGPRTDKLKESLKSAAETTYHYLTGVSSANNDSIAMDGYKTALPDEALWQILEPMLNKRSNSLPEVIENVLEYHSGKKRAEREKKEAENRVRRAKIFNSLILVPAKFFKLVLIGIGQSIVRTWNVIKIILGIVLILAAIGEIFYVCMLRTSVGADSLGSAGYTLIFIVIAVVISLFWHSNDQSDASFAHRNIFIIPWLIAMALYAASAFWCFIGFSSEKESLLIDRQTGKFVARMVVTETDGNRAWMVPQNQRLNSISWHKRYFNHFRCKLVPAQERFFWTYDDTLGLRDTAVAAKISYSFPVSYIPRFASDTEQINLSVDSINACLRNSQEILDSLYGHWYGVCNRNFSDTAKRCYNKRVRDIVEKIKQNKLDTLNSIGFTFSDVLNGKVVDKTLAVKDTLEVNVSIADILAKKKRYFQSNLTNNYFYLLKKRYPKTDDFKFTLDLIPTGGNK
jgi:hypothetical protein